MGYIHCCGGLRKTKSYRLVPRENFVICELDVLKKCPVCGHMVVQLTRVDENDEISTVRKVNAKAKKFYKDLQKFVLYEKIPLKNTHFAHSNFYLNYNEYGVKKRCYSNLRTLKIGLCENKYLIKSIKSF